MLSYFPHKTSCPEIDSLIDCVHLITAEREWDYGRERDCAELYRAIIAVHLTETMVYDEEKNDGLPGLTAECVE